MWKYLNENECIDFIVILVLKWHHYAVIPYKINIYLLTNKLITITFFDSCCPILFIAFLFCPGYQYWKSLSTARSQEVLVESTVYIWKGIEPVGKLQLKYCTAVVLYDPDTELNIISLPTKK